MEDNRMYETGKNEQTLLETAKEKTENGGIRDPQI
jgi:hypothetical protein